MSKDFQIVRDAETVRILSPNGEPLLGITRAVVTITAPNKSVAEFHLGSDLDWRGPARFYLSVHDPRTGGAFKPVKHIEFVDGTTWDAPESAP